MQMQLDGMKIPKAKRLVLLHESDEDGLVRAALGVLRKGHQWVWRATIFDRINAPSNVDSAGDGPAYEDQDEPALPPIQRRPERVIADLEHGS
jgi:hypothetical protein